MFDETNSSTYLKLIFSQRCLVLLRVNFKLLNLSFKMQDRMMRKWRRHDIHQNNTLWKDTQHYALNDDTQQSITFPLCRVILQSVILPNAIMPNVILQNATMSSVIMPNAILPNVILRSAIKPTVYKCNVIKLNVIVPNAILRSLSLCQVSFCRVSWRQNSSSIYWLVRTK